METIKIQVEIGFKEATLQVLDQMLRSIHKTADKFIEAPAQTAGANEAQAAKSDPQIHIGRKRDKRDIHRSPNRRRI